MALRSESEHKMLDQSTIQKCREAFNALDSDGSGTIETEQLFPLLEALGKVPTEDELFEEEEVEPQPSF